MRSVSTATLLGTPETVGSLPPAVVFGAGIDLIGIPGEQTVDNALSAASLLNAGILDNEFVMTVGYGPDTNEFYPVTESSAMAGIITTETTIAGGNPPKLILQEEYARDTLGSLWNIAPYVEEHAVDALTFIGARYHVSRAAVMGRIIFGKKVEIVPVRSVEVTSLYAIAKEIGTTGLYWGLTTGLGVNDRRGIATANKAYRAIVRGPKAIVSAKQPAGSRYGRKAA